MKINKVELFNIGAYEGLNVFDIAAQNESGKITVIGGKNGAGKTTLFTSIKLCLYGYKEAGYQAMNAYYKRAIKKLINDKAKVEDSASAYVRLIVSIFNGQEWDNYSLTRSWNLAKDPFESFAVEKKGILLSEEEIEDFDNYLLNIIPPELFELYFFDGEQIADFFLEDSSGERIKTAFLTICGYDTFDILYRNFKRLSKDASINSEALNNYFSSEDQLHEVEKRVKEAADKIATLTTDIEMVDTELAGLEKRYSASGGVSLEEWNQNFLDIKNEERIREEKNAWLKGAANDMIPYLILHSEIDQLVERMNVERDIERQKVLLEAVDSLMPDILSEVSKTTPGFSAVAKDRVQKKITEAILSRKVEGETILNLSKDEYDALLRQAMNVLSMSKKEILSARKEIKDSIKRSQKSREAIDESHITHIDSYLKMKDELLSQKAQKISCREEIIQLQKELNIEREKALTVYRNAEKELEKHLKNESLSDLTARSIRFLDVLQKRLFRAEIAKVESLFMDKMAQLMRKEQFISKIVIDDDFAIHVYKRVPLECKKICANIAGSSFKDYEAEFGSVHCSDLLLASGCEDFDQFIEKYSESDEQLNVLIEFDKSTMSKGEKQVFIMALYWSIMELSNKEVPFIIDTPFARIDTEHRAHITEFFFKELRGQVFIFSTDEEITQEHLDVIGTDLQSKFLIENLDNTKTQIFANTYFGE